MTKEKENMNQTLSNQEPASVNSERPTIGALLRTAREKRKLSLKVIGHHTKINSTNLDLLENDCLENLPNRAYVTGFVKSYARTVQLDEKEALEVLDDTYRKLNLMPQLKNKQVEPPIARPTKQVSSAKKGKNQSNTLIKILALAFGTVVALSFYLLRDVTPVKKEEAQTIVEPKSISEKTPLNASRPPDATSENAPVQAESIDSPEKVSEAPQVNTQQVVEPVQQAAPVEKTTTPENTQPESQNDQNSEEADLRPFSLPLYRFNTKEQDTLLKQFVPETFRQAVVEGKQNVFVTATEGDCWLTYKADDGPIKKFELRQGRSLLVRGDVIRFFFGAIGHLKIFVNNQPLEILDAPNGVKSIVIPQEKATNYKLPLFVYKKDGTVISSDEISAN